MKKLYLILLIFGTSNLIVAQDNVDVNEMIGFACYAEGKSSKVVKKVTKKIERNRFKPISRLLKSDNNAERYMAVITLERLNELKRYNLNIKEKELIRIIKSSEQLVSVCSGCVNFKKTSLKELFKPEFIGFSKHWLDYYIKMN